MKDKKFQEYDGYKMPTPRHFSKEELETLEKEKKERIQKILHANTHLIKKSSNKKDF